MRILFAVSNYPQLSESYVDAEIAFLLRRGVKVEIWAPHVAFAGMPELTKVHRGSLMDAVRAFHPDVVHSYYLVFSQNHDQLLAGTSVPMTVRGHSFDFAAASVESVIAIPRVKKVFLYPHFARQCRPSPKIVPLPVAYDSTRYRRSQTKDWKAVFRTAVGKPDKGLLDFFTVAALCREFSFAMAISDAAGDPAYFNKISEANTALAGGRVGLHRNVPREACARMAHEAGIYLNTSDPKGHPFAMPISIAEAMATGAVVLVRESPAAREYVGSAGRFYSTKQEAAEIIHSTMAWTHDQCRESSDAAVEKAKAFTDDHVLPKLIEEWSSILGGK